MSGPVSVHIDEALRTEAVYSAWRSGAVSKQEFATWVREQNPARYGLTADQLGLATRAPLDAEGHVDACLDQLKQAGVIESVEYPKNGFRSVARVIAQQFQHDSYLTYIFPEEARLLFALSYLTGGSRWAFLGSYYGYWAAWAMAGIVERGGEAVLVDVDRDALRLSRRNFDSLGWSDAATFLETDATHDLDRGEFDVCVLDAEGPEDHPDMRLRDKAIYGPILEAALPTLKPGGLVIAHNMMFSNPTRIDYFEAKIARNVEQYAEFQSIVDQHFDARMVLETTEGVGVYRRSGKRA